MLPLSEKSFAAPTEAPLPPVSQWECPMKNQLRYLAAWQKAPPDLPTLHQVEAELDIAWEKWHEWKMQKVAKEKLLWEVFSFFLEIEERIASIRPIRDLGREAVLAMWEVVNDEEDLRPETMSRMLCRDTGICA